MIKLVCQNKKSAGYIGSVLNMMQRQPVIIGCAVVASGDHNNRTAKLQSVVNAHTDDVTDYDLIEWVSVYES